MRGQTRKFIVETIDPPNQITAVEAEEINTDRAGTLWFTNAVNGEYGWANNVVSVFARGSWRSVKEDR